MPCWRLMQILLEQFSILINLKNSINLQKKANCTVREPLTHFSKPYGTCSYIPTCMTVWYRLLYFKKTPFCLDWKKNLYEYWNIMLFANLPPPLSWILLNDITYRLPCMQIGIVTHLKPCKELKNRIIRVFAYNLHTNHNTEELLFIVTAIFCWRVECCTRQSFIQVMFVLPQCFEISIYNLF